MKVTVFTLFPHMFPGPLITSIIGRGLSQNLWSLCVVNIRDYATDKHKTVDDAPMGGGPGMVMRADVIHAAFKSHYGEKRPDAFLYMSPRGCQLKQNHVKSLAKQKEIGLLCGRFEGVDQRLIDHWNLTEISLGDYVLSGGELAAMVLIDACARLIPGVIGCEASLVTESFSNGLLEYPQYTRPQVWNGMTVPDILTSGHHKKIEEWRQEQSEQLTKERRPDLWSHYRLK